jgi:D-3-phosphoglycerate dehydrogenase / 2-oxoglutarate reductase
MPPILLTHVPNMLENYYGPRAPAEMRKHGEVRLNTSGKVLDATALAEAAKGCEIIVSDRQTPGPAEFFSAAPDCCVFLRVAVDIRNIDVDAASRAGVLVTRATPGFMASVSEMTIGMMIDLARGITDATISYRKGEEAEPRMGRQLKNATVGIMGYGAISRHLAPICGALGMKVLVSDPYAKVEDSRIGQVPLETLLAESDFVVLPGGCE